MFDLVRQYWSPRHWPTWIGLTLLRIMSWLPLPLLAGAGYGLGSMVYLLHVSRRRIALRNISACFPELTLTEQRRINRLHYCYLGQLVMTISMNWWISAKRFDRLVTINDRRGYDDALANGRNVILLTPHFLAMEVSGLALQRERPMVGMYQHMKNPLLNTVALRRRQRFCPDGIMFERKQPLRSLLKILLQGLPMAYSPDQDAMRKGVFAPFFHPLASTTPALAKFIQVTQCLVIPCRTQMRSWGRGYDVYLGEPIESLASGDDVKDATAMNQAIEQMVRACPEQYLWVHKRFKTRPAGEPNFYR